MPASAMPPAWWSTLDGELLAMAHQLIAGDVDDDGLTAAFYNAEGHELEAVVGRRSTGDQWAMWSIREEHCQVIAPARVTPHAAALIAARHLQIRGTVVRLDPIDYGGPSPSGD